MWQTPAVSGSVPGGRWGHRACYCPAQQLVAVFGGHDGRDTTNELLFLDVSALLSGEGAVPLARTASVDWGNEMQLLQEAMQRMKV